MTAGDSSSGYQPPDFGWMGCLKVGFVVLAVLLVIGWCALRVGGWTTQTRFLPAELGLDWRYANDDDGVFMEACGVAVFGLDSTTVSKIEREGIAFFDDVHHARGVSRVYGPWRPTPVPRSWSSDGTRGEFTCARWLNPFLRARILEAFEEAGSYYSDAGPESLVVIPQERLVLMLYVD
jgi:hypothetical protein